jgi:hypothetical protein
LGRGRRRYGLLHLHVPLLFVAHRVRLHALHLLFLGQLLGRWRGLLGLRLCLLGHGLGLLRLLGRLLLGHWHIRWGHSRLLV